MKLYYLITGGESPIFVKISDGAACMPVFTTKEAALEYLEDKISEEYIDKYEVRELDHEQFMTAKKTWEEWSGQVKLYTLIQN